MKYDLNILEGRVSVEIDIEPGPQRLSVLAARLLELSSIAAEMGAGIAQKYGRTITCKGGCGCCCRQLVPLSPLEAVIIFEVTESLPIEQQEKVKAQFAAAHTILQKSELLPVLSNASLAGDANQTEIARTYFDLGIACPFLQEESCSIYPMRPSRCREYLVISPPENCAVPYKKEVQRLPISVRLSQALTGACTSLIGEPYRLVPHITALDWAREHEKIRYAAVEGEPFIGSIIAYLNNKAESSRNKTEATDGYEKGL